MTNTRQRNLPAPPEGYGEWWAHVPEAGVTTQPSHVPPTAMVTVLLEGDFVGDTPNLFGSWNQGEARQYDWGGEEYLGDGQVIRFCCIYLQDQPEPTIRLDTSGMDTHPLWGSF